MLLIKTGLNSYLQPQMLRDLYLQMTLHRCTCPAVPASHVQSKQEHASLLEASLAQDRTGATSIDDRYTKQCFCNNNS